MKHILAILAMSFMPSFAMAQELNAKVAINTAKLENTNTEVCETLRQKVEGYGRCNASA